MMPFGHCRNSVNCSLHVDSRQVKSCPWKKPGRSRAFFSQIRWICRFVALDVLHSAIDIKRTGMQKNLQAVLSQTLLACLLMFTGMATGWSQSEETAEADAEFKRSGYYEAGREYVKAYGNIKSDIDLKGYTAFMAGECFRLMLDPRGAEEWYKKSIGLKYAEDHPEVYLNYGDVMRAQQEYDDAMEWYQAYKESGGDASVADERIRMTDDAAFALDEPPSRYIVENLLLLNTDAFDFGAGYASKKSDAIVFASSRESSTGSGEDPITGQSYMDLFSAEVDRKENWSTPKPLNNTVNTDSNEGTVTFDRKFKNMYFTRCVADGKNTFACDIYRSSVMGSRMGPAEIVDLIGRDANDSSQVGHPAFSPENDFLLFASDMEGGYGGKDIYYAAYDERNDVFGEPVNLGPTINSSGDEMFPSMRFDGALFFATSGRGGMGGLDIFKADPVGEEAMTFGEPEALLYPLNSTADDFGIVFYEEEDRGIFTSNRPGGKGKDDLYMFYMPDMKFCYRANVYDNTTGNPLMANFTIQGSDGSSFQLTADADGAVSLCEDEVKKETSYTVDVKLDGYIGKSGYFSTVGLTESTTFAREFFLKEVILEEEYPMPLVLYPFNEAELLVNAEVNSEDSLDYLVDLMDVNETFVIQLESHTDTRGDAKYNRELSQRRAQTCVDYLISKGVVADRLVAKGRGEDEPIITDREISAMKNEDDKEAAHQMNRRTVFKIIRFDYVPGQ